MYYRSDTEVETRLEGVKKGRAPGIDEVLVEMIVVVGEIGVNWTTIVGEYYA